MFNGRAFRLLYKIQPEARHRPFVIGIASLSYLCAMNTFSEGRVLLINKPLRWTSFDAVRKIRNLIRIKKVGHAGTLDPLATGLLIVCTGKFTKKINEYMAKEKEYTGSFTLGATTPTYDLESEPVNFQPLDHIDAEKIRAATAAFTGEIMQVPPAHSAIKIDGKRVYELARKGVEVKIDPRKVTVHEFEITNIELPVVEFRVVCSTGTYIRSLANDFGAALGCGGYLSSLCRTRIGEFLLENAITPAELEEEVKQNADQNING
jgi:tRNA pseudouridine55 synthase